MTIETRLAEIRARVEKATPGPWAWGGNVDSQNLRLQTWNHRPDGQSCGVVQIMDFVRQGMQGAQPRFMEDLMMVNASDRAIYEVAPTATSRKDPRVYRGDIVGIKHPDAEFIAESRTDLPALLAAVEAVMELHRPMGIYDECQCESPSPEDGEHKRIDEVGVTCNRLYFVCRECCTDDGYQREECANYHEHGLLGSDCPTVQALTAALEVEG